MHLTHTHFLVLPGRAPNPCDLPRTKKRRRKKKTKQAPTNLHCLYIHWNMVKAPVVSPLKKMESIPTCTPTRSHRWRATLQYPYHNSKSSLQWLSI